MKSIDPLVVYLREYRLDDDSSAVRQKSVSSQHSDDSSANHPKEVINSDPFVKNQDNVYDIRIKRIAEVRHHSGSLSSHLQYRDLSKHDYMAQTTFRVDSKDYSSLSEINMIFKGNINKTYYVIHIHD